jgi:hypothetical protein
MSFSAIYKTEVEQLAPVKRERKVTITKFDRKVLAPKFSDALGEALKAVAMPMTVSVVFGVFMIFMAQKSYQIIQEGFVPNAQASEEVAPAKSVDKSSYIYVSGLFKTISDLKK